ncbi:MAG: putative ABC transport system permease protein [Alteromonadaceae bacterium]|jgi:putative ABC transport system permease protein
MLNIGPIFNAMLRNKSSVILMVLQVALTLAIVSNAAYIINERLELMQRDTGLDESQLFSFNIFTFAKDIEISQQLELDEDMLRAIPGVNNAVAINQVPLTGAGDSSGFRTQINTDGAKVVQAGIFKADEHLLKTLGLTVIEGRDFTQEDVVSGSDAAQPNAVIITKAMADELFPDGNALGKDIYQFDKPIRIIGVVKHMQGSWLSSTIVNKSLFSPVISPNTFKRFLINADKAAMTTIMSTIAERMLALNKGRVIMEPNKLEDHLRDQYQADNLMVNMLIIIISIILFITALGVAGMAIFNVNRRKRQIGTRRALGASQSNILSHFMIENLLMTVIGIVIGVVLTVFLNGYLMEYFSSSRIASSYIITTIIGLVLLGQLAVLFPAKSAAAISPAIATRSV